MSQTWQQQLTQTGDFLSITRAHELSLEPFSFEVTDAQGNNTQVEVLDTGVIRFTPTKRSTSKAIVLSSGVHGNETAPIEICADLVQQLILGQLTCAEPVLFLFGNPRAMNIGERFVEENMNRLFSGGHSIDQGQGAGLINQERHRALALENFVRDFFESNKDHERIHYDLHTAIRGSKREKFAVYPFRHGKAWDKTQLSFLHACGVDTILLSGSPTTTFSYYSSNEFGAHAFTVELGKVRPFGENDMANFSEVRAMLTKLVSGQVLDLKAFDNNDFHIYQIDKVVNRTQQNFKLTFADDVENFTDFEIGTVLAYDGETAIKTDKVGEAIIFPNAKVAIGQRAILTVVPTEI